MKEWYLMDNYKPIATSTYESDAIFEFAQSNFLDVLDTAYAETVSLFNQDLSQGKDVRCVIQGNSADTYLKSMERIGLFPIGVVKAGMYVLYDDRYWLITGYPSSNKVYDKATMKLCQYKLRWQRPDGSVIERWANIQSSSKYDDGLKESENMTLTSDSLMLLLPNDDESLTLDGKRVFIDKKAIPDKVYLVSRADSVLYDYGDKHGGIFCFITEKTEKVKATDRQDLRLCDYIAPTTSEGDDKPSTRSVFGKIMGNKTLKLGYTRSYNAELKDDNGKEVDWCDEHRWSIESEIDVISATNKNKITLSVEDPLSVGDKFRLCLLHGDVLLDELVISVVNTF